MLRSFGRFEKFLIIFSALLILLESVYLLDRLKIIDVPLFHRSRSDKGVVIAVVKKKENRVRLKSHADLVWEDAQDRDLIHNQDSVLTLDKATAALAMSAGGSISMMENTLVTFEADTGRQPQGPTRIRLSFAKGSLVAQDAHAVTLKTQDYFIVPEHDSEILVYAQDDKTVVEATKGKIFVLERGQQPQELGAGFSAELKPQGMVKNQLLDLGVTAPLPGSTVYLADKAEKARLQWTALDADSLELARGPSFQDAQTFPLQQAQQKLEVSDLKGGQHFWRLKKGTAYSNTARFFLVQSAPLELVSPAQDQRVSRKDPVSFMWKKNPDAVYYEITIGPDASLSNSTIRQKRSENFTAVDLVKEGAYYWKVIPVDSAGERMPASPIQRVNVMENILAPPVLKKPDIRIKIKTDETSWIWNLFWNVARADDPTYEVLLSWNPNPEAEKYQVQISKDRGFHKILLDETTAGSGFTWETQKTGLYFYRVASVNRQGIAGTFSDPQIIALNLPAPAAAPKSKPAAPARAGAVPPPPTSSPAATVPQPPKTQEPKKHHLTVAAGASFHYLNRNDVGPDFEAGESGASFNRVGILARHKSERGDVVELDGATTLYKLKSNESDKNDFQQPISIQGIRIRLQWQDASWCSTSCYSIGVLFNQTPFLVRNSPDTLRVDKTNDFGLSGELKKDLAVLKNLPNAGFLRFNAFAGSALLAEVEAGLRFSSKIEDSGFFMIEPRLSIGYGKKNTSSFLSLEPQLGGFVGISF